MHSSADAKAQCPMLYDWNGALARLREREIARKRGGG